MVMGVMTGGLPVVTVGGWMNTQSSDAALDLGAATGPLAAAGSTMAIAAARTAVAPVVRAKSFMLFSVG